MADTNVRARREPRIALQRDQIHARKVGAHHRRAIVARGVVDHDDAQGQHAGAQRLEAGAQQLAGIERNDDDANRGHSTRSIGGTARRPGYETPCRDLTKPTVKP